jgi:predicted metal-dependent HD superfamily phosphohydrolase
MLDAHRFRRCWNALQAQGDPAPIFAKLRRAYDEPHRAYHDMQHLADCLQQLDCVRDQAIAPMRLEMSLWYHDAIYDPRASNNEARSAALARSDLHAAHVPCAHIEAIDQLIMATKHDSAAESLDAALLVDIDLSILGRSHEEFEMYDRAIRAEYAWVPADQYRAGRSAVLERFLARPAIYTTPWFRARYEVAARRNLALALEQLQAVAGQ